jgi:hypothetical protein
MLKVLGSALARLHTKNFVIVIPHHTWKDLVNVIHLHILLCHIVGLVLQCYAFPSIFNKNCFILSNLCVQYLRYPSSFPSRAIPCCSGSRSPQYQTSGAQMARTILQRSHYTWKSPKRSLISSAATPTQLNTQASRWYIQPLYF